MEDIFNEQNPKGIKEWFVTHQIGLLGTVIFHLLILILVLILKLNPVKDAANSVSIEFLQPAPELKTPAQLAEELLKKNDVKQPLTEQGKASTVRNVAVNSNLDKLTDKLVDDKFGSKNTVYEEARQLEEKMKASQQMYKKAIEAGKMPTQTQESSSNARSSSDKAYKGASVLAYSLQGRQGTYLPVPAYLCEGGGDIVVDIAVNQKGYVTDASISSRTTGSECLFAEALKAARRSRFTVDAGASSAQKGSITYRFVAQ